MKSIRGIIILIAAYCCLLSSDTFAQQLPLFTQYSEYGGLINPAHIPFDNLHFGQDVSLGVSYRDQWIQLPDRPKTLAARYEKSSSRRYGANLTFGGMLLHDEIGVFTTTEIKGRLAAFFKTKSNNEIAGFSLGLNLGISQYRANLADLAYVELDPILFKDNATAVYPDLGVGLQYINEFENNDYLQVGLAVPQLFGLDHSYKNDRKEFDIKQVPHVYLSASYYKMFSQETFLEFSGWVKRVKNIPINFDLICRYRFAEHLWLGAGANSGGIIHTEAGWIYSTSTSNQLRIGYSFNPTFYSHSIIFGNIHELNISYSFRSSKK